MPSIPPPSPAELEPGDVLAGRYRLTRRLGEGGMGIVWEGLQIPTDKRVAIKVLKGTDRVDTARFLREAKVASALSHRNIVQVFDFWEVDEGGPVFMVMELLAGETLAQKLERVGRLSLDEMVFFLAPVVSAVRASHAQGIVHRDLKPENIFLVQTAPDEPVEVKVVDFGLARPVTATVVSTAVTQSGAIMGTPFYMAPEQVYGEKDIDTRADLWALGVVMYECISGTKPFLGDNLGQLFKRLTEGKFKPLRDLAPDLPPTLDQLVARMLSHDKELRPTIDQVGAWFAAPLTSFVTAGPITTQRMPPASLILDGSTTAAMAKVEVASTGERGPTLGETTTGASMSVPRRARATGIVVGTGLIGAAIAGAVAAGLWANAPTTPTEIRPSSSTSATPLESVHVAATVETRLSTAPSASPAIVPAGTRDAAVHPPGTPKGSSLRASTPPTATATHDPLSSGRF